MENKNYCVYCHTNKANGKKYIGITCQKPEKRWNNGKGYKTQQRFWRAISLYGWDAFTHEIWYTDLTKEEAEVLEIELIAKYETQNPLKGYNVTPGGDGVMTGRKHSQESRKKMSEAHKGKPLSEETKRKLSESLKGRKMSEETRQKMKDAYKNASLQTKINRLKGQGAFPIQCIETGVIFLSRQEAAAFAKVGPKSIQQCCLGTVKTAGGFRWQRVTWEEYEAQEAQKGGDTNARCETNYERKTPESD